MRRDCLMLGVAAFALLVTLSGPCLAQDKITDPVVASRFQAGNLIYPLDGTATLAVYYLDFAEYYNDGVQYHMAGPAYQLYPTWDPNLKTCVWSTNTYQAWSYPYEVENGIYLVTAQFYGYVENVITFLDEDTNTISVYH